MAQGCFIKRRILAGFLLSGVLVHTLLCGCGSGNINRAFGLNDLENPDPTVKILAVKWAGDNKVPQAMPYLVDNLHNDDKAVRFYSIKALVQITETDCGYDYKTSPLIRNQGIECWQRYLELNEMGSNGN